jgi:hypothetical protein
MSYSLARSIAVGVFAAGVLLGGAAGIASAEPAWGAWDDGDYMDDDLPPSVAVAEGPNDLTYCPPGYHIADDAIPAPGVPKGCELSSPFVAVPPAVIRGGDHEVEMEVRARN